MTKQLVGASVLTLLSWFYEVQQFITQQGVKDNDEAEA